MDDRYGREICEGISFGVVFGCLSSDLLSQRIKVGRSLYPSLVYVHLSEAWYGTVR